MASGLVQTGNRKLIEDLMRLLTESGIQDQKETCGIYQSQSTRKTRKRKMHSVFCNNGYKSIIIQCALIFTYVAVTGRNVHYSYCFLTTFLDFAML